MTTLPERRQTTKEIAIKLDEDDFARMGKLAAEKGAALRAAKDEFDRVKKVHKAKIDTITGELDTTLRAIADGAEKRNVDCDEVFVFETNTVETWHNGEKVDERAMEPHERQTRMFDGKEDEDDDEEEQAELPLVEKPSALDAAVDKELDDKPAIGEPVPPVSEQVRDEFKQAAKIVKGW